jgi:hypothetical protein
MPASQPASTMYGRGSNGAGASLFRSAGEQLPARSRETREVWTRDSLAAQEQLPARSRETREVWTKDNLAAREQWPQAVSKQTSSETASSAEEEEDVFVMEEVRACTVLHLPAFAYFCSATCVWLGAEVSGTALNSMSAHRLIHIPHMLMF